MKFQSRLMVPKLPKSIRDLSSGLLINSADSELSCYSSVWYQNSLPFNVLHPELRAAPGIHRVLVPLTDHSSDEQRLQCRVRASLGGGTTATILSEKRFCPVAEYTWRSSIKTSRKAPGVAGVTCIVFPCVVVGGDNPYYVPIFDSKVIMRKRL